MIILYVFYFWESPQENPRSLRELWDVDYAWMGIAVLNDGVDSGRFIGSPRHGSNSASPGLAPHIAKMEKLETWLLCIKSLSYTPWLGCIVYT